MRLLINTASTLKGGGVQVAKSFIAECKKFPEHEYHIVLGITLQKLIAPEEYPANFHFYTIGYRPATKVFTFKGTAVFFKNLEAAIQPDCVFTTSGPSYWRPQAPHLCGYNLPHYIYPDSPFFKMISLYKRIYFTLKGVIIKYYVGRDADNYVVQTDDVNQRLKKWFPQKNIYTVTNTYAAYFNEAKQGETFLILPPKQNSEYRFLMLSANYRHKNFPIINKICALIPANSPYTIRFVTTLPNEVYEQVFTAQAKKYIINTGYIRPEDCPALYAECDFMFMPTLLECFSATYAEAMVMRKPILTSNLGFAHTVCKDAALYFDPLNAREILDKMHQLIGSPALQQQLIDKGVDNLTQFSSATQRAVQFLNICNKLQQSHTLVLER
jgi:glycosyltransferase involved in cell wall biosynthesis